MESTPTNQHYVPQFMLRRFASTASRKQIYVFDKSTEHSFSDAIRNVASAPGFYEYESKGNRYSIDPALTRLESTTSSFIKAVVEARSLRVLGDAGRETIAFFASVQLLRTAAHRRQLKDLNDGVHSQLVQRGIDPGDI